MEAVENVTRHFKESEGLRYWIQPKLYFYKCSSTKLFAVKIVLCVKAFQVSKYVYDSL